MTTLDKQSGESPRNGSDASGDRPLRKDAARNRELLVAAAREVFARRGLEAGLDEIAREAGVGVGTAYRHFGNKFDLAVAVLEESLAGVLEMAESAAVSEDPWAGLVTFVTGMVELQVQDRGLREAMLGVLDAQRKAEFNDRLTEPVSALLERGKAAGAVRPDAAVSDLAFLSIMLCQVADMTMDATPDLWRRYLPSLLAALCPDGPALEGTPLSIEEFRTAMLTHLPCQSGPRPRG